MGKNKSTKPEEREFIWRTYQNLGSIAKVVNTTTLSRGKVVNAINHFRKFGTFADLPRKKPRKTTPRDDQTMVLLSKRDPFRTSTEIRAILEDSHGVKVSARTVRRRLAEKNLHGRIARKKPNVSKKNVQSRLKFVRDNLLKGENFWKTVVWSDEVKVNVYGNDGKPYVRRPKNAELNPKYTKKTVKHGGDSLMVWGCFTSAGVGPLCQINGRMTAVDYKGILQTHLLGEYTEQLPPGWVFQHDNDPKHTARVVKAFLEEQNVSVLEWPAQSPDLNPIENLWGVLKKKVAAKKPTSKANLWTVMQEEWQRITPQQCAGLVDSMQRRMVEVHKQGGYPTKY